MDTIPHLSRYALHRLFQRHGISRLPDMKDGSEAKKKFKSDPIGHFHIDIAEARTEESSLNMFGRIDRTSKVAFVKLEKRAMRAIEHRLTKANHLWSDDRADGMSRILKEAMARRHRYDSHAQFREHFQTFMSASFSAEKTETLQDQSKPPHAGTKHIALRFTQ